MVGPKIRAFSFVSGHRFALFVSLWVSSRGILVVVEAPEPVNVHVLGLLCEAPAVWTFLGATEQRAPGHGG